MQRSFFVVLFIIFALFYFGCEQGIEPVSESQSNLETMQISPSSNLLWPAGATLNSATFSIFSNLATENTVVEVFVLTKDWTENGVTWNSADFGVPWTTPGGDLGVKVGEINTVAGFVGWYHVDIAPIVSEWIAGTADNFGFLLKQSSGQTLYHSSEYSNVLRLSTLTVDNFDLTTIMICKTLGL